MEFLAFNPLQPIVDGLIVVIVFINKYVHNLGWSLILLAALIRLAFWPLAAMQFKSMAEMQAISPLVKALQAKYKGEPQKMNAEVMALYKEHGVNPFASCLPLLVQLPILFSLYWAITAEQETFKNETWGWIGTPFSHQFSNILATSLSMPDYVLLGLYVISMYFSVKLGSPPSTDPQQAQTQKIMSFMSPVFIAWFGRSWPSALILYWLSINIFTMAQQFFLMRKYTRAIAAAPGGGSSSVKDVTPKKAAASAALAGEKAQDGSAARPRNNGSSGSGRKGRSRR